MVKLQVCSVGRHIARLSCSSKRRIEKSISRTMTNPPVRFYHLKEPYGEFSNFYPAPIELDGHLWPTSEHYFQAQKFSPNGEHYTNVRRLATPREAFDYARTYRSSVRDDWQSLKDAVMFKACLAKFGQHKSLKQLLLSTGDRLLVEHTTNDSYWGDGGDGTGKNQLGITLMKVRDCLLHH